MHRLLGVAPEDFAAAILGHPHLVVSKPDRAQRIVEHRLGLGVSGASGEQVMHDVAWAFETGIWQVAGGEHSSSRPMVLNAVLALCLLRAVAKTATRGLNLELDEFERRLMELCEVLALSREQALKSCAILPRIFTHSDPGRRASASAQVIGRLMQAAAGISPPLPPEGYMPLALNLVAKHHMLWSASALRLDANWSALRTLGLPDPQVCDILKLQPVILSYNLQGSSMQLRAAWLQDVLGLSLLNFFSFHPSYVTNSTAKMATRAGVSKAADQWEAVTSQLHTGGLLNLLIRPGHFCKRVGCTPAHLDAFDCQWLQTAEGRRWSGKTGARGGTHT